MIALLRMSLMYVVILAGLDLCSAPKERIELQITLKLFSLEIKNL